MASPAEKRKSHRVQFSRGISVQIVAIDGTWNRACKMEDVSQTGAKLSIKGSLEGFHLKEFFLVLSTMGTAFRRCELVWINGSDIGVRFLTDDKKNR
ncbi:PilZ domain-containing protein [Bradyrhizobium sp. USDA 3315]